VQPLSVSSERELALELDRILNALNKGTAVDWEKRCAAAKRGGGGGIEQPRQRCGGRCSACSPLTPRCRPPPWRRVRCTCCSVSALVRLEGLVKGGAAGAHEGVFMENLRALKDPLLDQMVDRCVLCSCVCVMGDPQGGSSGQADARHGRQVQGCAVTPLDRASA
jgi:hypothetical protein